MCLTRRQAQARGLWEGQGLCTRCLHLKHATHALWRFSWGLCTHLLLVLQGATPLSPLCAARSKASHNLAEYISAVPADSAQLRRVALTLPPPARLDFRTGTDLPRTTHLALEKLLNACGVSYEFSGARQVLLPQQITEQISISRTVFLLQCFAASQVSATCHKRLL